MRPVAAGVNGPLGPLFTNSATGTRVRWPEALSSTLADMRIEALGPVRLSADTGEKVDVAERHLRLLLVSLVSADGEPVPGDVLIDRLWGQNLPAAPKKVLRSKLSRLRGVLDEARPGARDLLTHTAAGYRLAVDAEDVDVTRFKRLIEHAHRTASPEQKEQRLREALEVWRGEPYGDAAHEIWLAPSVAELRDRRGQALESLAESLLDQGRPEEAVQLGHAAVADYPTRERLLGAVMLGLYQVGRQHEALELFESLRRRLGEELAVDPGPRIRELHVRILRQAPALTARAASEDTHPVPPRQTNVPAEIEPLIGRRHERDRIRALLDEFRLVTLDGVGGVGKTRLALHLASERTAHMEHGVWFIDLTELSRTPADHLGGSDRIAALAVAALDPSEGGSTGNDATRVCEALGSRSALFVLDNCEHVIEEAATFAGEVLGCTPGARILATSREPLGLPEENRYYVGALSTEPTGPGETSEAVEFFTTRARAVDPGFTLEGPALSAVSELCRRLDGLPLALELAAGRMRGISVHDLLERLSDRLNLLRRSARGVPPRQQTLRGMIDWSWSLLVPREQAVLRRLAVHPGSVSLASAEATCADDPHDPNPVVARSHVVDVLLGLVDRSMVRTVSSPIGVRYGLLESIGAYAEEKLDEAGERHRVARRHLDHCLGLAREADHRLRGPEQRQWLAKLDAERTQLRNAFDEAVRLRDGDSAVALAVATFWYLWISGHHGTLHEQLRTATSLPSPRDNGYAAAETLAVCVSLDRSPGQEAYRVEEALLGFENDDVARARVQWFAGTSLLSVGVREAGEHHVDEAIGILSEAGEDWHMAVAACQRDWFVVSNWGDPPRGLPDGRNAEEVLRTLGDGYGLAQAFDVEHRIAEIDGDHWRAARAAHRALEVCLEFGLGAEASYWYAATAVAALRSGEVDLAVERVEKARALESDAAEHGSHLADFAELAIARHAGDLRHARVLLEKWMSDADLEATQAPGTHIEDGFLAVQEGDLERAESAFRTVHALVQRRTKTPATALALELAASIRALRGEWIEAAELLGTAAALREPSGVVAPVPVRRDLDRAYVLVRAHLSAQRAEEAFQSGRGRDPSAQMRAMVSSLTS